MATPGTIGTVGAAASAIVALIAVGQVESIGFVLQAFGLGSVIGTAMAYRARRRGWSVDGALIIARWALGGAGLGALVAFGEAVPW